MLGNVSQNNFVMGCCFDYWLFGCGDKKLYKQFVFRGVHIACVSEIIGKSQRERVGQEVFYEAGRLVGCLGGWFVGCRPVRLPSYMSMRLFITQNC